MRLWLVIFFAFITFSRSECQIVFCPPGATWNYAFTPVPQWSPNPSLVNETISYIKDSIVGADTAKVLVHSFYYSTCYHSYGIKFTLIRQKGDTVFFRNERAQHTWQILFNFASAPGTGWQTNYLKASGGVASYSYIVDSVGSVSLNNHTLKRLYLGNATITERIGWDNAFLFSFFSFASCDGYYYKDFYCYGDAAFGVKQFTDKPCYFSGVDDITELEGPGQLVIFPNPPGEVLNISCTGFPGDKTVTISNNFGTQAFERHYSSGDEILEANVAILQPGLYIVTLSDESGAFACRKFLKE